MQHGDAGGDPVDRQADLHELLAQGLDEGLGLDQAAAGTFQPGEERGDLYQVEPPPCGRMQHSALKSLRKCL